MALATHCHWKWVDERAGAADADLGVTARSVTAVVIGAGTRRPLAGLGRVGTGA